MTSPPLRIAIAEDEPLARRALRRLLLQDPGVEIVADLEDAPSLRAYLRAGPPPDVVFVDIRMPGGSVFEVLSEAPSTLPVVFTTAHAEHAAAAFELDAVDYLRKPFGARRVHEALERVRRRRGTESRGAATDGHVVVRVGVREVPVRLASIWRFEGADDCVRLITADRTWLHGATLQELEDTLAPQGFLRIHRRHLVHAAAIRGLVPHDAHRLAVELPNGERVVASRRGTAILRAWAQGRLPHGPGGTRS